MPVRLTVFIIQDIVGVMERLFLLMGAVSAFLAVALGAFGAHGLKSILDDYSLKVFHTGVEYQFYHALALIMVGSLLGRYPGLERVGWAFAFGTVVFSGSLYALALTGVKILGAITPIGGVSFLVGWALLALSFWRAKNA